MRIIAGKYRGLKLESPKNNEIRPTTDRLKEDIFNILMPYISGSVFLDLFSGSGAVGFEALSRGADKVYCVDASREAAALINKNAAKLKFDKPYIIIKRAKNFLIETNIKYDIIFMDPPYAFTGQTELFNIIEERGLLNEGGVIVYEQSSKKPIEEKIGEYLLFRKKTISLATVAFYKKQDEE